MARKMAEVQAASERSRQLRAEQEESRMKAIEETALRAAQEADAREKARAEAKAERERKAKEGKKAKAERKQIVYVPGDGLTHETGKPRLNVEREGGCVCGCGQMPEKKRSRFIPGHDARMYRLAKAYTGKLGTEEMLAARETITDRQKSYLKGRNLI